MSLAFGNVLLAVLFAQGVSEGTCADIAVSGYGYAICVPTMWYKREMRSGAVFLCSEPKGNCTASVGGMPLNGQATLAIMPLQVSKMSRREGLLADIVRDFIHDPAALISDPVHVTGPGGDLEYIRVWESFSLGALKEQPKDQYSYFVRVSSALFRATLLFHANDARGPDYQKIAREVVTSVRLLR